MASKKDVPDTESTKMFPTKCQNEKKRREQENIYLEELAELMDTAVQSDDNTESHRPDKCAILEETVKKIQSIQRNRGGAANMQQSILGSLLPKEVLGPLVLEALHGFMFLVSCDGKIDFISDNVNDFVGFAQHEMEGISIYNFIHPGDHARFSFNLIQDEDGILPRSGQGADTFLRSRVFTCRFLRQPPEDASSTFEAQYETMQVSALPIQKDDENAISKEQPRVICVARKVSSNERSYMTPVEQFTTQLDPSTLRITAIDTSGMDRIHGTSITKCMLGNSLMQFCHPQDKDLLQSHIISIFKETGHISRVYRMYILAPNQYVRVETKSKLFKPVNGSEKGVIMATHSIIGETELRSDDLPSLRQTKQQTTQPLSPHPKLGVFSPSQPEQASDQKEDQNKVNNNHHMKKEPQSSTDQMNAQQKNQLLKQLLNVNFSRPGSSPPASPPSVSNSRILQLLSQRGTADYVPSLQRPPNLRLKRPAPVPTEDPSSPKQSSVVCTKNPALADLLAKPPHSSVSVPPPVPTKWHQEPKDKLPKDIMRKFLPPHPSDRPINNNTVVTSSSSAVPVSTSIESSLLDDIEQTLNSDAMLSEILDGVIDIQEKHPTAATPAAPAPAQPQQQPPRPKLDLSDIEKYLAGGTDNLAGATPHHLPLQVTLQQKQQPTSYQGSPYRYPASSSPRTLISSTSSPQLQSQQQAGKSPGGIPRMNELLQVVPPNVSISTGNTSDLDSLLMMQQRRQQLVMQQQHHHSGRHASGGGPSSHQQYPVVTGMYQRPLTSFQQQGTTATLVRRQSYPGLVSPSSQVTSQVPLQPHPLHHQRSLEAHLRAGQSGPQMDPDDKHSLLQQLLSE